MTRRKNRDWVRNDGMLRARLPMDMLEEIERRSMETGLTLSAWVRMTLLQALKTRHKKVTITPDIAR